MKKILIIVLFTVGIASKSTAQRFLSQEQRDSIYKIGQMNQDNMMKQLGITELRSGPSGNPSAPNSANYDQSLANPCPTLPEILVTNNGNYDRGLQEN